MRTPNLPLPIRLSYGLDRSVVMYRGAVAETPYSFLRSLLIMYNEEFVHFNVHSSAMLVFAALDLYILEQRIIMTIFVDSQFDMISVDGLVVSTVISRSPSFFRKELLRVVGSEIHERRLSVSGRFGRL